MEIEKKWLITFFIVLIFCIMALCMINYIVDPFGVFGDKFFKWYTYDIINNQRIGKIEYLDKFHERYNSYIIGGSKSSAMVPGKLNQYFDDAKFYSMMMYGGDFYDYERIAKYLIDHYEIKNLMLHMSVFEMKRYGPGDEINNTPHAKVTGESLAKFYLKLLTLNLNYSREKIEAWFTKDKTDKYSVIRAEDGVFEKTKVNARLEGNPEEYVANEPSFHVKHYKIGNIGLYKNVEALERIKKYCEEHGVNFFVVAAPTHHLEMDAFNKEEFILYWKMIANITDFWDFSGYNSISMDSRNFYDVSHYSNRIGELMMARMFNDNSVYVPEDFGRYVTKDNIDDFLKEQYPEYSYVIDKINNNK